MRRTRGLTLVEVTVSIALLSIVFLGLFASLLSSSELSVSSTEGVVALQAAQNELELMKATPFATVFATYYSPVGKSFPVSGLGRSATGKITFLSEQTYGTLTGKPVDLDFDGSTGGTVPSSSYAYFPVQISVTWASRSNRDASSPPRTVTITSAIFNNPGVAGQ